MTETNPVPSPPRDRFLYVIISLGLVITLLVFSADSLIGAVGLRAWYNQIGVAAATTCLALIPFILFQQRFSRGSRYLYLLLTVALVLVAIALRFYLILVGWFTSIVTGAYWFSASSIAMLFTIFVAVQLILAFLRGEEAKEIARTLILLMCIYSVGYFYGAAANPRYAEAEISDQLTYNDHQYFLYMHFGWLGDPDYLALYECNSIGLFCSVTYEAPTGYYRDRQLSIVVDPQAEVVGVQIDNLFSPQELTESDVAYLCTFFQIDEDDSFCTNPLFQDYTSFRRMLRRTAAHDFSYRRIMPYFERSQSFNETACPPPDTVLSDERRSFTCRLQFPDSDMLLVLQMNRSTYNGVSYRVDLVNLDCNCHNIYHPNISESSE